jgi:CheY-like chemotaxis protein
MKKVLVIGDQEYLQLDLPTILGYEGYQALVASNREEDLRLAREHTPHLVISDVNVPMYNGLGLVTELRQDPQTAGIPIILLVVQPQEDIAQPGVVWLVKPYSLEDLLAAIKSLIGD